MAANHLVNLPEEERYLMAPRWVYDLAEIDALDAILGTAGTLGAYALGGVPGIVAWGGICAGITVIRKTPLIPWTVKMISMWRRQPQVINGRFREAVFPSWREGVAEVKTHPATQQAHILQNVPQDIDMQTNTPVTPTPISTRTRSSLTQTVPPAANSIRWWVQQYQGLSQLRPLHGRHIVIFGPTGMGKSSIIKWLLRQRQQGTLLICDPHFQPGNWPGRAYVVGKGRNFSEIAETIQLVIAEMGRRYAQAAEGEINLDTVTPIYLVIDEMSALAEQEPEAIKQLLTIAQEGRKVQIFTFLTPHGQNVATMGLKGRGEARVNFAFIEGQPVPQELQRFPRIVTVTLGAPKEKDSQRLGRFIVPAPQTYTAKPHFGVPQWLRQGAPGVSLRQKQGIPGDDGDGVSEAGGTPGSGFEQRFGAHADETHRLALYLAQQGYGVRKIGKFLPFGNVEAEALARKILSGISQLHLRPVTGSAAEQEMVRYLHWDCGASLERIAKLLDGNTWENLSRIEKYAQ